MTAPGDGRDLARIKIVPRNLTARADYVVRGNPANSRPESGVDNCYPGLEFDQRNLEQRFFPGLTFEFQRPDGAVVVATDFTEDQQVCGLTSADALPSRPLYLWMFYGRNVVNEDPVLFGLRGQTGPDVWRRVHDLLPGRVAILLGPGPGFAHTFNADRALELLEKAYGTDEEPSESVIVRGGGPATAARLEGAVPGPWELADRDLTIEVDGGEPVRVSFTGSRSFSVARLAAEINRRLPGVASEVKPGAGTLALTASRTGPSSSIRVSGGAARALGLPRRRLTGRAATGLLEYAVLVGDRARYLDPDGVVEVASYPPGELTKTMCAPWMYDFRECFCFYWAASKPDVVEDGAGRVRYVNFLRNRTRRTDPPPLDTEIDAWARMQTELTQTDLVEGWWHKLPVVLDDQEQPAAPRVPPPSGDLLDRDEAIAELRYLATVEHALIVEFLYAAYSVKAERRRPPEGTSDLTMRIWSAADQVFRISIDEMRHFLWVNMILRALGAPPSTGRAAIKGEAPRGLRKAPLHKSYLDQKFSLEPLTPGTIERFIQIERPSQEVGTDLDGMYVGLLASIVAQPRLFPEGDRIAPIVKLLIDEGQGHYRRFDSVRQTLEGIAPERYLRPLDRPPTPLQEQYLALCDEYYQSIMEVIEVGFRLPAPAGDMLVREAVRSMENLDDVARRLAAGGVGPRFTMPEPPPPGTITAADAMQVFSARRGSFDRKLGVMAAGEGADVALIARHRTWSQHLQNQLTDIVKRPPEP